jgi:peptidoglycan/xylan/chitin deacetylase (PgdA/CDA1 family)
MKKDSVERDGSVFLWGMIYGVLLLILIFFFAQARVNAATNVIPNGELETPQSGNTAIPDGWIKGRWGTNTAVFTYPVTSDDGSKAARVQLTAWTSGDAKWAFTPVAITAGKTYTYADSYTGNIQSIITLEYTNADGSLSYQDLGTLAASGTWKTAQFSFTPPANARKVTVFHLINKVGTLTIDHANLSLPDAPPSNLVPNPSLESTGGNGLPVNWAKGNWGTNASTFTYPVAGHTGDKAAKVAINSYTSGDAKWYFTPITTSGGKAYRFSDYYIASAPTVVTVQFTKSDGTYSYLDIGEAPAASNWTPFTKTFTTPMGTTAFTVFHLIQSTGTLTVDDYNVTALAADPTKFDKGYVSINFDDGYRSAYENALPILDAAGFTADSFIITSYLSSNYPGYIRANEVQDLQDRGYTVGAHTRTHQDLTQLSASQRQSEISGSRQDLLNIGITPVNYFAYPVGGYNAQIEQQVKDAGFKAARSSDGGDNDKTTDLFALRRRPMDNTTTFAQVKNYIDAAMMEKTWTILLFHEVDNSGDQYAITPALFQQIVNYLKQKNITPITIDQGVKMMQQ